MYLSGLTIILILENIHERRLMLNVAIDLLSAGLIIEQYLISLNNIDCL